MKSVSKTMFSDAERLRKFERETAGGTRSTGEISVNIPQAGFSETMI